jgi:hypothetical protein
MRRLVLVGAALLVLAACSAQPAPIEPKASASAPTSPRPTATLTPPPLPKQAERKDATGAANFVLYWVKVSNYAALTGDTDRLRSISDPACEGCNRYIDLYERTYAAGGYLRGAGEHLESVETESGKSDTYVRARVSSPRGRFKSAMAARTQITPAETVMITFAVRNSSGSWVMTQIGLDE